MPNDGRRPKRIGRLIQEALGRILATELPEAAADIVAITRVDVQADLKSARIFVSAFGPVPPDAVLALCVARVGAIRHRLAMAVELKYNPRLVFALDPSAELNDRIERLLGPKSDTDERPAD
jgi:ribosome-binding factor A